MPRKEAGYEFCILIYVNINELLTDISDKMLCSGKTEKQLSCISVMLFDRHESTWQREKPRPAAASGKAEVISLEGGCRCFK